MVLLLSFERPVLAGYCVPPDEGKDAYHYVLALVRGMSYAKTGIDRFTETPSSKPYGAAFDLLYAFRLAKADLECAASQVTSFTEDPREEIRLSAVGASTSFWRLAELYDEERLHYKELLDAPPTKNPRMGTLLDRRAERASLIDDAWKLLMPAAISATYSVIAVDPSTGLWSRLSLSTVERDEVLHKLRSTFGTEITKGPKAGQLPLIFAATMLYEVIGNQGRATRDELTTNNDGPQGMPLKKAGSDVTVPHPQSTSQAASTFSPAKLYLAQIQQAVDMRWVPPPLGTEGAGRSAVMKFRVNRDGRLGTIWIEQGSGNIYYDASAKRAIQAAAPFPPFPSTLSDSFLDVTYTFSVPEIR